MAKRAASAPQAEVVEESSPAWARELMNQVAALTAEVGKLREASAAALPPAAPAPMGLEAEIAHAFANPEEIPWHAEPVDLVYERDPEDEAEETRLAAEIVDRYPDLIAEIGSFNETAPGGEAVSGEELDALLAGLKRNGDDAVHPDELPDGAALTEDQIQMLVAEANSEPAPVLGDADVEALLAQAEESAFGEEAATPAPDGMASDDDIAALLAQAAEAPAPEPDGMASDDDIAALLAQAAEAPAPEPDGMASDDDIAALLAQAAQTPAPEPDGMASDDDIAALLAQAEASAGPAEPAANVVSADELEAMLSGGHSVPSEAPRMSDDEISRLMAEANTMTASDPIPSASNADEVPEMTSGYVLGSASGDEDIDLTLAAQAEAFEISTPEGQDRPDPEAIDLVPAHFAARAMALPLRIEGDILVCLVAEPIDQSALGDLSRAVGKTVQPIPGRMLAVVKGLRDAYSAGTEATAKEAVYGAVPSRASLWTKVSKLMKKAS